MKIEHLAIWTQDLEVVKDFYMKYFNMESSDKYINSSKKFSSYFLSFPEASTRLEIMNRPDISALLGNQATTLGLTHFSISVGNKVTVDKLTEQLRKDGYTIAGEPRTTGDGYYESVVLDPEGNSVEITE
ncbi:glyoxalase/bleomycin resistance/extradiol dioxygenase family protein [Puteibacter caeruleilacunae]|nr:glyoxalase/bleomycin resistance/extradiol dioxygenase family protein [Puteibacter caeruleilacunae]